MVFSHLHNVDCVGHVMWERAVQRGIPKFYSEDFKAIMEYTYIQTDNYLGNSCIC